MIGAIIGYITGSRFEFNNTSDYRFELFANECSFTDDTICTIAIADAIIKGRSYRDSILEWCRKYPHPMGGYGASFARWVSSDNPQPYNSFGNGAAMRVAPVAYAFNDLDEVKKQAELTAIISHNHPEGIKGAVAVAHGIYILRTTHDLRAFTIAMQDYYSNFVEVQPNGKFDETCQCTVPLCLHTILVSCSFEDAIRNAISSGGDSDTIGAIVGLLAEAMWGVPKEISDKVLDLLPTDMINVVGDFFHRLNQNN